MTREHRATLVAAASPFVAIVAVGLFLGAPIGWALGMGLVVGALTGGVVALASRRAKSFYAPLRPEPPPRQPGSAPARATHLPGGDVTGDATEKGPDRG